MIPVNEPLLQGNEKKYLAECIDTGWISSEGPFVRGFEEQFSDFIGVKHGISVCNGTAALETALYAIGVGEGDEVILPSFTIISCVTACLRLGAKPVLVDIVPDTWTMDVSQVEAKITPKTKAVMPVHMYGHPVEMDPLFQLQENYGFKIIEDAAQVQGAEYYSVHRGGKWLKCGAMGDIAATSFYANKIITTGEGGMVVTENDDYAQRARSYQNLCFRPEERFFHTELGYNFRMSNIQAAVGLAQCEQIEAFISIKRKLGEQYAKELASVKGIRFMPIQPWAKSVYWMYCVELDPALGIEASTIQAYLREKGIGTRPFFKGMHAQPVFWEKGLFEGEAYPQTDLAYKYGFYLPSGLTLTADQVSEVTACLQEALKAALPV